MINRLIPLLFTLLSLIPLYGHAAFDNGDDELLAPEEAFALSVSAIDDKTINVEWNVADGYYLYRSKFKIISNTPGIILGEAQFPKGKVKQDEFFGAVEIYRGKVAAKISVSGDIPADGIISVTATSQGCADIGVCYPPFTESREVKLTTISTKLKSSIGNLSSFIGNLAGDEDEILEPDQAFRFNASIVDGETLKVRWDITPKYYLYRNKFEFSIDSDNTSLGRYSLPAGEEKDDEFFGKLQVFHNEMESTLPLVRTTTEATTINLRVTYQGCAEAGVCYPPIKKSTQLALPSIDAISETTAAETNTTSSSDSNAEEFVSEQDSLAASLAGGSTLATIALFFGMGLLLTFTPCVFPMIPILSSIIVGQGDNLTTRRAFTLSLAYVLAMALTYTVVGVIAGLSGANLQVFFQDPVILSIFAVVFVALSFSMFGFYELQLPSSWQGKLSEISNSQQGGTLTGTAIMGFLSALIVGPCVTAPLIGALIYISQTGDAVLGGLALFALSMGMGTPLLIVGTSAGKLLPRAGGWMDSVKAVFGVMLLAVAVWMLERILPASIIMVMWAMLLIIPAIYMHAADSLPEGSSGWSRLWKGVGIVMLVQGILILVAVAAGGNDPLQPLKGISGGMVSSSTTSGSQNSHVTFQTIKSVDDLERAVAKANAEGKTAMLDFYADWCVSCKEFEKYTFTNPGVIAALGNTVTLQADVTDNDAVDQELLKKFGIIGPPAILFFGLDGKERKNFRVVGYMEADSFTGQINGAFA
ncbi:MAG: protein-disulfide reductase DsbD, partial [Gammaproteobacteria bacterium]|nr:protein-disulfide reductase DsbD [Gammaproteobacteria bacterium]